MAALQRRPKLQLQLPEVTTCRRFIPAPMYTNQADENPDDAYEKIQVLGRGIGGTVYKVRHKETSSLYALKVIPSSFDETICCRIQQELDVLRLAGIQDHIVRCHKILEKPYSDVEILMEYVDGGTLEDYVRVHGNLPEDIIANIAGQVLNGMNNLHAKNIVHRDIKPANILINQKGEVKIADFGISKIMKGKLRRCKTNVGTCAYMSPERLDIEAAGGDYDGYAADVWSLGLTFLELFMGHYPYQRPGQRLDRAFLLFEICFGEIPTSPDNASDNFKDFISCCLKKDWNQRWTVAQLLLHPFLGKEIFD